MVLKLQRILDGALSLINKEQNCMYPPHVFTDHVNVLTGLLINEGARVYGTNNFIRELLLPFVNRVTLKVDGGLAQLPIDYRQELAVGIAVANTENGKCDCEADEVAKLINTCNKDSPLYDPKASLKGKENCKYNKVDMLVLDEFYTRSNEAWKVPTHKKPIGVIVDKRTIKVCPIDVTHIELIYLREPKEYRIIPKLMPDDTWQIDEINTQHVESEWHVIAEQKLITGLATMYAIYSSDRDMKVSLDELKKLGFF